MDMSGYIVQACEDSKDFLLKKNKAYGNSVFEPVRIFAKGISVEDMINVRMDDKLSRLLKGDVTLLSENDEDDLLGYLLLKKAYRLSQKDVVKLS